MFSMCTGILQLLVIHTLAVPSCPHGSYNAGKQHVVNLTGEQYIVNLGKSIEFPYKLFILTSFSSHTHYLSLIISTSHTIFSSKDLVDKDMG